MIIIKKQKFPVTDLVKAVSYAKEKLELSQEAKQNIENSEKMLNKIMGNPHSKTIYGVTTGFGALHNFNVSLRDAKLLQKNLIRSHAVGVGKPLSPEIVRMAMTIVVNSLSKGYSGVKNSTIQTIVDMLNKDVCPVIPEKGSVGCSGDLQPLAHMALVLMGEGEAFYRSERMSGKEAMKRAEIDPIELDLKEGLSLINSTAVMTAIGAIAVHDARKIVNTAEIVSALSLEAINGVLEPFDERVHLVRPHKEQIACARNIRRITQGSELLVARSDSQDPYSFRCIPQVIGACRDAISYAEKVIDTEINSVTDNPLIMPETKEILHTGNFHGEPVAIAMDLLGIALAEIGSISERRIARLLNPDPESDVPRFLIRGKPGLNSGLMLLQYTAASLVSESKVLAHPASVDSIPTSALQEDHVSMGTIAARKALEILRNTQHVIAIELLCATQALEFRRPKKCGLGTQEAYKTVRKVIKMVKADRIMHNDLKEALNLVHNGVLIEAVERKLGINLD